MELLTQLEHEAMKLSADLANKIYKIIREAGGDQWENDWTEAAIHIHTVQNMVLSQAAARAYPDLYRLMGISIEDRLKQMEKDGKCHHQLGVFATPIDHCQHCGNAVVLRSGRGLIHVGRTAACPGGQGNEVAKLCELERADAR